MKPRRSSSFRDCVLRIVQAIPRGETRTYGYIARCAGNPRAARAVGAILKTNYDPAIPCHRVIRADGGLGGYNRGQRQKQKRLREEGAVILQKN